MLAHEQVFGVASQQAALSRPRHAHHYHLELCILRFRDPLTIIHDYIMSLISLEEIYSWEVSPNKAESEWWAQSEMEQQKVKVQQRRHPNKRTNKNKQINGKSINEVVEGYSVEFLQVMLVLLLAVDEGRKHS